MDGGYFFYLVIPFAFVFSPSASLTTVYGRQDVIRRPQRCRTTETFYPFSPPH